MSHLFFKYGRFASYNPSVLKSEEKSKAALSVPLLGTFELLQLVEVELLLELINTSACVNKLLFAGEERMAFGTNINLNVILNGLGNIFSATSTLDSSGLVIGMETLLHFKFPLFHILKGKYPNISRMVVYHALMKIAIPFLVFFYFFRSLSKESVATCFFD